MLIGSAIGASLMPSTGLVSEPVRVPAYSKWKVVEAPLGSGVGSVTWTVELVVRRSELRAAPVASVTLVMLRPLLSSKVAVGEVFERGEGDVGGGGELGWWRGRGRR